jgi:hypothetical protein
LELGLKLHFGEPAPGKEGSGNRRMIPRVRKTEVKSYEL